MGIFLALFRAVNYKNVKLFGVTIALALFCFSGVRADKADFIVNDDGSVAEQNQPRIAVASDGGFVIVWVDKRSGSADIYLQRFDSAGKPVGRNRIVNDDDVDAYQAEPAVAVDLSGLYSVVWKDYRDGLYPFDPEMYFQRYDTAVAPVNDNRRITTEYPDSLKETPDIALSPWGGGVLVWADYRNHNWDIYGQLIASNGSLIGSNFMVNNDATSSQQHAPRVAVSPEGWFVVTWYDNRFGTDDIYVQRYDSLGNALGGNVRVNSAGFDARQAFPDVATDGAGHFTVVWVDWRNGSYPSNPDIYTRKFDTLMMPLTGDVRVNRDGTLRAQRQPTISADRRGNVALIWADSTGVSSWDIVGQMIDVEGMIREPNFQANADADSAQLQPDVALDGRNRYVTWADKRNGNFDIYASISKYNDPGINPCPTALKFEMLVGGELPEPQTVVLEHAGYNPINYEILRSHNWLTVSPASGITPDTITVGIATDTLDFGTYLGSLTLIDTDNHDSSVVLSVRLDVTAPILDISPDTLVFRAFSGLTDSVSENLTVRNDGGGELNWTLDENADWLSASAYAGTGDSVVTVWADVPGLETGNYTETIVIDGGEAMNSPDTVWAFLEVVDNLPYIWLEPEAISLSSNNPSEVDTFLVVTNAGPGILNWQAVADDTWLRLGCSSGMSGDTIRLSIDTTDLGFGVHRTRVVVTDSASFNVSEVMVFELEYIDYVVPVLQVSHDTLLFEAYAGIDDSVGLDLGIANGGSGQLDWTVREEVDWLTVSADSGTGDTVLCVAVNTVGLATGSYEGYMVVAAEGALQSPDTVVVLLELVDSLPYIAVIPDTISIASMVPSDIDTFAVVVNLGVDTVNWQATASESWLRIEPVSGINGDTIHLSVDTSGLTYGLYVAEVEIVDSAAFNLSARIAFDLDYFQNPEDTLPRLRLSNDSLLFTACAGVDDTVEQSITVDNAGRGTFDWTLSESIDWLTMSVQYGTAGDTVVFRVNAAGLDSGLFQGLVVFDALEALDSPDTVRIELLVVADQPYIHLQPDSIAVSVVELASVNEFAVVSNIGGGELHWQAAVAHEWLLADRTEGLNGDTIHLSIDTTGITYGTHLSWVDVFDSSAFNVSERLWFVLEYHDSGGSDPADTVIVASADVEIEKSTSLSVELRLINRAREVYLPLSYRPDLMGIDSVVFDAGLPIFIAAIYQIDSAAGLVSLHLGSGLPDSSLGTGVCSLAEIYVTAKDTEGVMLVDEAGDGDLAAYLVTSAGVNLPLVVRPGEVRISAPPDPGPGVLPDSYRLAQNYPNPFNMGTVIEFDLMEPGPASLEVFNILGQKVRTIFSGSLPAGSDQSVSWDGYTDAGRAAPSGIYFYRLLAGGKSLVRKMVLVK